MIRTNKVDRKEMNNKFCQIRIKSKTFKTSIKKKKNNKIENY